MKDSLLHINITMVKQKNNVSITKYANVRTIRILIVKYQFFPSNFKINVGDAKVSFYFDLRIKNPLILNVSKP